MKNVYSDFVDEYRALRASCGLLDHDGTGLIEVSGTGAAAYLGEITTRPVDFLLEGQSAAALVLSDEGDALAEVLVHCRADGYLVQVWPAQAEALRTHLLDAGSGHPTATVKDVSADFAVIALEGPQSFRIASAYLDFPISSMAYRSSAVTTWEGTELLISRTGVTGEYGYTFVVPADRADTLRAEFLAADAVQVGLDALDTCRMEMRFVNIECEAGTESERTPFHLGLQWMVDFSGEFRGRAALLERWESGLDRRLVCWSVSEDDTDATPLERGLPLVLSDTEVGAVAHAVYSPHLGRVIGTAYVDSGVSTSGLGFSAGARAVQTVSAPFLVASSMNVSME